MLLVKHEHRFLVGIVPLHRDFDDDAVALADGVEDVRMQDGLVPIHVLDETLHAAGEGETLLLGGALVDEFDAHAVVEERQLAQALGEDVEVKIDVVEGADAGPEMDLRAAPLGRADLLDRRRRDRRGGTRDSGPCRRGGW